MEENYTIGKVIEEAFNSGKNYFLWGKADTGKTLTAFKLAKKYGLTMPYKKTKAGYWLDYKNQKVVLLDDLTDDKVKYIQSKIIEWGDVYPFVVDNNRRKVRRNKEDDDRIDYDIEYDEKDVDKRKERITEIDPNNYNFIITSRKSPEQLFSFKFEEDLNKFKRLYTVINTDKDYLQGLPDKK